MSEFITACYVIRDDEIQKATLKAKISAWGRRGRHASVSFVIGNDRTSIGRSIGAQDSERFVSDLACWDIYITKMHAQSVLRQREKHRKTISTIASIIRLPETKGRAA